MSESASLADELFHQAALTAYVEVACQQQAAPCPEQVRRRAYELYEQGLAQSARNVRSSTIDVKIAASIAGPKPESR